MLNAVTAAAGRTVSFVSFTVPQYQRADSYFAPLAGLATGPDTELDFGIVPYHPGDQAPGTTDDQARLIDAALADSPSGTRDWGVCTECGMGRAGREEMPVLLDLHRQILAGACLATPRLAAGSEMRSDCDRRFSCRLARPGGRGEEPCQKYPCDSATTTPAALSVGRANSPWQVR